MTTTPRRQGSWMIVVSFILAFMLTLMPLPEWARAFRPEWCALVQGGCDPVLLREQALITPACGLALHGEAQAELVLRLANQLARRLRTQTEGMRLTVGA